MVQTAHVLTHKRSPAHRPARLRSLRASHGPRLPWPARLRSLRTSAGALTVRWLPGAPPCGRPALAPLPDGKVAPGRAPPATRSGLTARAPPSRCARRLRSGAARQACAPPSRGACAGRARSGAAPLRHSAPLFGAPPAALAPHRMLCCAGGVGAVAARRCAPLRSLVPHCRSVRAASAVLLRSARHARRIPACNLVGGPKRPPAPPRPPSRGQARERPPRHSCRAPRSVASRRPHPCRAWPRSGGCCAAAGPLPPAPRGLRPCSLQSPRRTALRPPSSRVTVGRILPPGGGPPRPAARPVAPPRSLRSLSSGPRCAPGLRAPATGACRGLPPALCAPRAPRTPGGGRADAMRRPPPNSATLRAPPRKGGLRARPATRPSSHAALYGLDRRAGRATRATMRECPARTLAARPVPPGGKVSEAGEASACASTAAPTTDPASDEASAAAAAAASCRAPSRRLAQLRRSLRQQQQPLGRSPAHPVHLRRLSQRHHRRRQPQAAHRDLARRLRRQNNHEAGEGSPNRVRCHRIRRNTRKTRLNRLRRRNRCTHHTPPVFARSVAHRTAHFDNCTPAASPVLRPLSARNSSGSTARRQVRR